MFFVIQEQEHGRTVHVVRNAKEPKFEVRFVRLRSADQLAHRLNQRESWVELRRTLTARS